MRRISTPWGTADSRTDVAEGIVSYSTPSHGGYHLSPDRHNRVRHIFPLFTTFAGGAWYEEDCDWCLVAFAFPEYFPPQAMKVALRITTQLATNNAKWQHVLQTVERLGLAHPAGWSVAETSVEA
jgi:hypothetical protein